MGRSRRGYWVIQRKTAKDRFRRALLRIKLWCRRFCHLPVCEQRAHLERKLRGHYAYYGITGNIRLLQRFCYRVERLWLKWLQLHRATASAAHPPHLEIEVDPGVALNISGTQQPRGFRLVIAPFHPHDFTKTHLT